MVKEELGIYMPSYDIEDLNNIIKSFNYSKKVIKRVYFIKYRYLGFSVADSAEKVGVSRGTGYNWQKIWKKGPDKLFNGVKFGGPRSKLSDDDLKELKKFKTDKMSVKEVKILIKKEFGVDFTEKHVRASIMQRMKNLKNME